MVLGISRSRRFTFDLSAIPCVVSLIKLLSSAFYTLYVSVPRGRFDMMILYFKPGSVLLASTETKEIDGLSKVSFDGLYIIQKKKTR